MSHLLGTAQAWTAGRERERRAAISLALFLAIAASSCTGPLELSARSQTQRPEVQAVRIEVLSLGLRTADLRLHLIVDNPGEALEGKEAILEWMLDDFRFASSQHRLSAAWPARQISEQTIDVSLAYFALPFSEFSGARRIDSFHLIVQGELIASAGDRQVAIAISAQTPISRPKDR